MLPRIKRFLAPPTFDDEEKTRVARLLHTVLLSFLVALVVSLPIVLALSHWPPTGNEVFTNISLLVMAALTLGLVTLTRRGRVRAASLVFLSLLWAVMAFWMIFIGGLKGDVSVPLFPMIIVLAGLLLGGRAALTFTILTVLAIFGAFASETLGRIPTDVTPVSAIDVVFIGMPIFLTGVLLRHAVNSLSQALDRARRNEQAQIQANRELEQIRASLEERVAQRTQDLELRSDQLQASVEIGRALTSILDIDQLIWQVVELIRDRFGLYHVGLFQLEAPGLWAVYRAGAGAGGRELANQGFRLAVGGASMIGWCTANGQVRVSQDVQRESGRVDHPLVAQTRSEAALPLLARGEVIGALSVQSEQVGKLDVHTMASLETIAEQVAIALDNARLFADSQAALEAARRAYGERSRLAWTEFLQARSGLGYTYAGQMISDVSGEWQPDMVRAGQTARAVLADSRLALPIQVRDQVVGVLGLEKAGAERWTSDEIALLDGLAAQLGAALESAQLFEETQRRAARDRLVGEATARLRQTLDIETVLRSTISEIGQALALEEVEVRLLTGAQQLVEKGNGHGADEEVHP